MLQILSFNLKHYTSEPQALEENLQIISKTIFTQMCRGPETIILRASSSPTSPKEFTNLVPELFFVTQFAIFFITENDFVFFL